MSTDTLSPPTDTRARIDLATRYLHALWGVTKSGYCLLWRLSDKRSWWYSTSDYARLAADAINLSAEDMYLGCGLSGDDLGPCRRVSAKQVLGIPGLWADVDFSSGGAHSKNNLPLDVESAIDLAQSACLPPSLIVHSGHGIYPWWLLQSPWIFGADAERIDAAQLLKDWQAHLMAIASARNQTIDATADLARVLRLPGTINNKQTPLPVEVEIPATIKRYELAEIRAALDYPNTTALEQLTSAARGFI